MAILVDSGRVAIAAAIANETLHLAWGSGSVDWDTTPVIEPFNAIGLATELGRRIADYKGFCTPNEAGAIVTTNGRFDISLTPTKYLYMRFGFDFTDAPDADIRELGIFMGATTNPLLPPGQRYFQYSDVVSPGILIALERIQKVPRSASARTTYELVLEI